jgi:hypothetical protein
MLDKLSEVGGLYLYRLIILKRMSDGAYSTHGD